MRWLRISALVAGLVSSACAQVSGGTTTTLSSTLAAPTSYQPTNIWTQPSGACSLGMGAAAATATPGAQGGVYQDKYGSYWEMVSVDNNHGEGRTGNIRRAFADNDGFI